MLNVFPFFPFILKPSPRNAAYLTVMRKTPTKAVFIQLFQRTYYAVSKREPYDFVARDRTEGMRERV